jgi:nucleotide-binding universal stress UspA family protein
MIKIERILCPVDLSLDSDKSLRYATMLARAFSAKLFVLHCAPALAPKGTLARLKVCTGIKRLMERTLNLHFEAAELGAFAWESIVIEGSNAAEAITQEAAGRGVDLIIMCSRRRPLRAALLGSTAEQVCHTAPCPVLVTHTNEQESPVSSSDTLQPRRVLVAQDFSEYSELALSYALSFAQEHQAELHLLHVLSSPVLSEPELAWIPASVEGAYHKAARALQTAVPGEAYLWCNVKTAVRWGKPYREILAYAEENGVDLILMGAHGTGFSMQALFGSNVDRVLRQSPCPVLVARPLKRTSPTPLVSKIETERQTEYRAPALERRM